MTCFDVREHWGLFVWGLTWLLGSCFLKMSNQCMVLYKVVVWIEIWLLLGVRESSWLFVGVFMGSLGVHGCSRLLQILRFVHCVWLSCWRSLCTWDKKLHWGFFYFLLFHLRLILIKNKIKQILCFLYTSLPFSKLGKKKKITHTTFIIRRKNS